MHFCGEIGGKIMVFGSPKQRNTPPSSCYEDTWNYLKEAFLEVLYVAEERNVIIALEPLARSETNIFTTAEEVIRMINEISHPNFKLHLDVKAMSDEERPIPEIIASAREYLTHFHANDPNMLGPGFGEVKYEPIRAALEKIGYERYISVEVFDYSPGAEVIAEKSIKYLKEIFG
ncbi:MAG TPA: sugar phosphate isomerase/epimerase [Candidatus Omnitrophica bacterium]|nr:sugar phosphate isomerase/epimerase [Candidatus Omnitrophota bacterium]